MADPIIPGVFRAQVRFSAQGAAAGDSATNSFTFRDKGFTLGSDAANRNIEEAANEIATRLSEFYFQPVSNGSSIADFIRPDMLAVREVRVYALADPPQRLPETRDLDPRTAAITGITPRLMPREMAICASFFSHRNMPRRRGRVFLGPLRQAVLDDRGGVVDTARTTILEASQRLASEGAGDNLDWSVLSAKNQKAYPITAGWVDNEFDSQRSREMKANARDAWTGPGHNPTSVKSVTD